MEEGVGDYRRRDDPCCGEQVGNCVDVLLKNRWAKAFETLRDGFSRCYYSSLWLL